MVLTGRYHEALILAILLLVVVFFASYLVTESVTYPLPSNYAAAVELERERIMPTVEAFLRITPSPGATPTVPPEFSVLNPIPGKGPYVLTPAPDNPEPGKDFYIFPFRSQALRHLRAGARIAAFCFFDLPDRPGFLITPTPLPPGPYPAGAYVEGEFGYVPLSYLEDIPQVSPHLVLNSALMTREDFRDWMNAVMFKLNFEKFSPERYCRDAWKRLR